MYISASAPDAPPFSDTTIGGFIRLFFWIAACIIRAIWSEAPPAPAATTISTGLVGSQAAVAGALASTAARAAAVFTVFRTRFFPILLVPARRRRQVLVGRIVRINDYEFKQVAPAMPMTFALDCKPLTRPHLALPASG